jgi:hypothetical protein
MNFDDIISFIKDLHRRLEVLEIHTGDEDFIAPTLSGTWVNFDGSHQEAGYYRSRNGEVHLRGLVKSGSVPSTIFTLPAGYRPSREIYFPVLSNGAIGRITIETDGDVVATAGNTTYISLDGISFRI